jgi:hypothetical protein
MLDHVMPVVSACWCVMCACTVCVGSPLSVVSCRAVLPATTATMTTKMTTTTKAARTTTTTATVTATATITLCLDIYSKFM